jgi:hypothetical protein
LSIYFRYFTHQDALACLRYISGTTLDDRTVRADLDPGYKDGRQYGRGKSGGQVRDEYREDWDPGRGGYGHIKALEEERIQQQEELYRGDHDYGGRRDVPFGEDEDDVRFVFLCLYIRACRFISTDVDTSSSGESTKDFDVQPVVSNCNRHFLAKSIPLLYLEPVQPILHKEKGREKNVANRRNRCEIYVKICPLSLERPCPRRRNDANLGLGLDPNLLQACTGAKVS